MKREGSRTLFVNAVEKGFQVLSAFQRAQSEFGTSDLSLSEIAQLCGFDTSTAQRFTNTLVELDYLEKDQRTRHYRPGIKLLDLSYTYLANSKLAETAIPILIEAGRELDTSINLCELHHSDIVYTIRIPHEKGSYRSTLPGRRVPASCTSGGIAILSRRPEEEVNAILDASQLHKYTEWTITDMVVVKERIELARSNRYHMSVQQMVPGEISTASPILDVNGLAIASVQIPVYMPKWTPEKIEKEIVPIVMGAAQEISRAFCGDRN